jgi:hypothetical protein
VQTYQLRGQYNNNNNNNNNNNKDKSNKGVRALILNPSSSEVEIRRALSVLSV